MPAEIAGAFRCPACGARGLEPQAEELRCSACGAGYPLEHGVPVLLPPVADAHKARQAHFFDEEVDAEFELTRPVGTPAFHSFLLERKHRLALGNLAPLVRGRTVLVVCGGSGMDAHFLALAGARVVTADISPGAARRARGRADRFGLQLTSIVADAEQLPFADKSMHLVYVHDGLHHLERPLAALAEMARVAAEGVAVSEPTRAAATTLAVRLGLAHTREEAGNEVTRLSLAEVTEPLRRHGFDIIGARRYAMRYSHEPGLPTRVLSTRPLLPLARGGLAALNVVAGRAGNKLAVQAIRRAVD